MTLLSYVSYIILHYRYITYLRKLRTIVKVSKGLELALRYLSPV